MIPEMILLAGVNGIIGDLALRWDGNFNIRS
jgi:hypothetical protein